jgi:hypothetical protein
MDKNKILAFDIGIKNLAFCVLEQGTKVTALENVNLLPAVESVVCQHPPCKLTARFQADTIPYCKRHLPKNRPVLTEWTTPKVPANKVLKDLVREKGCPSTGTSNAACIAALSTQFAIPFEQPKQTSAAKVSLETIHDALRAFVHSKRDLFLGCTHVLLENQPAFKNPHMKSVQVLLFAVLRDFFLSQSQSPVYQFIHAKKKVADAQKGDAGYAERKSKSEDRVKDLFTSGSLNATPLYMQWVAAKKKSDMADALCMCVDHFASA